MKDFTTEYSPQPNQPGKPGKKPMAPQVMLVISFILADVTTVIQYGFFAQFEHSDWFPKAARHFLNEFEIPVFGGLWVCMFALFFITLKNRGRN